MESNEKLLDEILHEQILKLKAMDLSSDEAGNVTSNMKNIAATKESLEGAKEKKSSGFFKVLGIVGSVLGIGLGAAVPTGLSIFRANRKR